MAAKNKTKTKSKAKAKSAKPRAAVAAAKIKATKPAVKTKAKTTRQPKAKPIAEIVVRTADPVVLQDRQQLTLEVLKSKVPPILLTHKRQIYIGVIAVLIIIPTLLLVLPLLPKLTFVLNPPNPDNYVYAKPIPSSSASPQATAPKPIPQENRLVIPKIGVDAEILEANDIEILNQKEGVWHDPNNRDPLTPGNMVIAGHRFQYTPPNTATLYNLDQITVDDTLTIFWKGQRYDYKVYKVFEVTPDHLEIANDTPGFDHELTIYTCTPIYTSDKRLVVKAILVN